MHSQMGCIEQGVYQAGSCIDWPIEEPEMMCSGNLSSYFIIRPLNLGLAKHLPLPTIPSSDCVHLVMLIMSNTIWKEEVVPHLRH